MNQPPKKKPRTGEIRLVTTGIRGPSTFVSKTQKPHKNAPATAIRPTAGTSTTAAHSLVGVQPLKSPSVQQRHTSITTPSNPSSAQTSHAVSLPISTVVLPLPPSTASTTNHTSANANLPITHVHHNAVREGTAALRSDTGEFRDDDDAWLYDVPDPPPSQSEVSAPLNCPQTTSPSSHSGQSPLLDKAPLNHDSNLQEEIKKLRSELDKLKEDAEAKSGEVIILRRRILSKDEECVKLKQELLHLQSDSRLSHSGNHYGNSHHSRDPELAKQVDKLTTQLEFKNQELREHESRIQQLQQELEEERSKLRKLTAEFDSVSSKLQKLEANAKTPPPAINSPPLPHLGPARPSESASATIKPLSPTPLPFMASPFDLRTIHSASLFSSLPFSPSPASTVVQKLFSSARAALFTLLHTPSASRDTSHSSSSKVEILSRKLFDALSRVITDNAAGYTLLPILAAFLSMQDSNALREAALDVLHVLTIMDEDCRRALLIRPKRAAAPTAPRQSNAAAGAGGADDTSDSEQSGDEQLSDDGDDDSVELFAANEVEPIADRHVPISAATVMPQLSPGDRRMTSLTRHPLFANNPRFFTTAPTSLTADSLTSKHGNDLGPLGGVSLLAPQTAESPHARAVERKRLPRTCIVDWLLGSLKEFVNSSAAASEAGIGLARRALAVLAALTCTGTGRGCGAPPGPFQSPVSTSDGVLERLAPLLSDGIFRGLLKPGRADVATKALALEVLQQLLRSESLFDLAATSTSLQEATVFDRVVHLLSSKQHGTDREVRPLRRKAVRLLSRVVATYGASGMRALLHSNEKEQADRLFSAMVLLLHHEVERLVAMDTEEYADDPVREGDEEDEGVGLVRETLQLMSHVALHIGDIAPHLSAVRHLYVSLLTRLEDGAVHTRLGEDVKEQAAALKSLLEYSEGTECASAQAPSAVTQGAQNL